MIYLLTCGVCATVSKIESAIPSMEWECQTCLNIQTTSVPVDKFGEIITTVGFGSIIGEKKEDVLGVVLKSDPVSTKAIADTKAAELAVEEAILKDGGKVADVAVDPIEAIAADADAVVDDPVK